MATWATIHAEIVAGMTANSAYSRIPNVIDIEDNIELSASDVNKKYTLKCKGIKSDSLHLTNIGGYIVELKVSYSYMGVDDYDTAIDLFMSLLADLASDNSSNFPNFVGFSEDPFIEDDFEPKRFVGTINMIYGIKGCP